MDVLFGASNTLKIEGTWTLFNAITKLRARILFIKPRLKEESHIDVGWLKG